MPMTFEVALEADRRRDIVAAADAYEGLIADSNVEAMLNLLVLYWEATDFGTLSYYRLSDAFIARAGQRWRDLLKDTRQRHPSDTAVEFWCRYIESLEFDGELLSPAECRLMLSRQPENLEPAMIIFSESDCLEGIEETRLLLAWCKTQGTARAGYISAVLDGVTKRARFRW